MAGLQPSRARTAWVRRERREPSPQLLRWNDLSFLAFGAGAAPELCLVSCWEQRTNASSLRSSISEVLTRDWRRRGGAGTPPGAP